MFTKIPSHCKLNELNVQFNTMDCDLNDGRPINNGGTALLKISIDATNLNGTELIIKAQVHSAGNESNRTDNEIVNIIPLAEFSEIEVLG